MAQAGIATLCVNARLPPKSGRDAVEDYDSGLRAVSAAIDLLNARGLIDPQRVGMGGLSFGGEVTLWTASHSNLLAAASVSSSAASPTWYWFRAMQAGFAPRAMEQWGLGSPDETPERWRILSPAYYADRFRAPILMQMAEQEFRSAVEYFIRMRRAGAAAELWAYPDEPHIKFQPRHKLSVYDRNLDWFRFWLQHYADPAPEKADLYRRWRELRENSQLMNERLQNPESQ
jgi:dipeptidyl aminopeptidase/acylaminoacyl peptidase